MKNKVSIFKSILVASVFIIASCNKENKTELVENNDAVADATDADVSFTNMESVENAALENSSVNNITERLGSVDSFFGNSCAIITKDSTSSPKVITIDFGTVNCLCRDGINRRGKITISITGNYFSTGSIRTVTLDNFYADDKKIEGTKTSTNNGLNALGQMNWSVNVTNGKITDVNGDIKTFQSTRVRTQTAGQNTTGVGGWIDDEYDVTGTASGISVKGISYTASTITPLHKVVKKCKRFTSGILEIVPATTGNYKRQIDFGTGACDNTATVTVFRGNKTKTYTINFR